jgi:hypothetical protein
MVMRLRLRSGGSTTLSVTGCRYGAMMDQSSHVRLSTYGQYCSLPKMLTGKLGHRPLGLENGPLPARSVIEADLNLQFVSERSPYTSGPAIASLRKTGPPFGATQRKAESSVPSASLTWGR